MWQNKMWAEHEREQRRKHRAWHGATSRGSVSLGAAMLAATLTPLRPSLRHQFGVSGHHSDIHRLQLWVAGTQKGSSCSSGFDMHSTSASRWLYLPARCVNSYTEAEEALASSPSHLEEAGSLDGLHAQRRILITHAVLQAWAGRSRMRAGVSTWLHGGETGRASPVCRPAARRRCCKQKRLQQRHLGAPWGQHRSAPQRAGTSLRGQRRGAGG